MKRLLLALSLALAPVAASAQMFSLFARGGVCASCGFATVATVMAQNTPLTAPQLVTAPLPWQSPVGFNSNFSWYDGYNASVTNSIPPPNWTSFVLWAQFYYQGNPSSLTSPYGLGNVSTDTFTVSGLISWGHKAAGGWTTSPLTQQGANNPMTCAGFLNDYGVYEHVYNVYSMNAAQNGDSTAATCAFPQAAIPNPSLSSVTVTAASWVSTNGGKATFTTSADLRPYLAVNAYISISGVLPSAYNIANTTITDIGANYVTVLLPLGASPGALTQAGSVTAPAYNVNVYMSKRGSFPAGSIDCAYGTVKVSMSNAAAKMIMNASADWWIDQVQNYAGNVTFNGSVTGGQLTVTSMTSAGPIVPSATSWITASTFSDWRAITSQISSSEPGPTPPAGTMGLRGLYQLSGASFSAPSQSFNQIQTNISLGNQSNWVAVTTAPQTLYFTTCSQALLQADPPPGVRP